MSMGYPYPQDQHRVRRTLTRRDATLKGAHQVCGCDARDMRRISSALCGGCLPPEGTVDGRGIPRTAQPHTDRVLAGLVVIFVPKVPI
jgi:hypothetical protein